MSNKTFWADIEGYPNYAISSDGIVLNKRHNKYVKASRNHWGYMVVGLSVNKKRFSHQIHRLIANAFIPNPEGKTQINHIDGNKSNNCIENLEWVTPSENKIHAYTVLNQKAASGENHGIAKLTTEGVRDIRQRYSAGAITMQLLADQYQVCIQTISNVVHHKIWKE
jgi:hypothetical protein